ncbi:DivIVA domain-containing protein [Streptomyces alkaliterrae]|uniref:DivIVA domain-containing protein n=1 Tax=Streptomyces alkaliterrae TaxID=2213162 RepID=A0A5P0YR63_9ACTN|nr:DivIVA domain-containing protein [Streptomyces alkaliterrae]MBB1261639.1 DivIVA domain-containing protein [Streptomyces alkaliterrae]MQS01932.1 DivIVA domain-containing protein [Streptomyces alkaliterrae]
MFWFMLIGLLLVVGAVTLAVARSGVGGAGGAVRGGLTDPVPEWPTVGLPLDRPLVRADVDNLRLPLAPRGYRMGEVDDVLDRLGAELAIRDARIAELEATLAGDRAAASGRPDLFADAPAAEPLATDVPASDVPAAEAPASDVPAAEAPASGPPAEGSGTDLVKRPQRASDPPPAGPAGARPDGERVEGREADE